MAISIGFGLILITAPTVFRVVRDALIPILGARHILTSIASVSLNALFNRTTKESAERDRFLAVQAAEYIWGGIMGGMIGGPA